MPIIAYNMAKVKQMVSKDLLSNPKNGIIYFGSQMKGWLDTSEPSGKSAFVYMYTHVQLSNIQNLKRFGSRLLSTSVHYNSR